MDELPGPSSSSSSSTPSRTEMEDEELKKQKVVFRSPITNPVLPPEVF